jgi:hypothetical protein
MGFVDLTRGIKKLRVTAVVTMRRNIPIRRPT